MNRYADELRDYEGYVGLHRESAIMLLIALGWAAIALNEYGVFKPLIALLHH